MEFCHNPASLVVTPACQTTGASVVRDFFTIFIIAVEELVWRRKSAKAPCQEQDYEEDHNVKTWKGLSLVEAVRAREDRSQWRRIVHDMAKSCTAEEG